MAERGDQPAPMLVLLPGLDGTGKLFSEILKALEGRIETMVVDYPKDVPLGYDELEVLVRAALPDDRPFVLSGRVLFRSAGHPHRRAPALGTLRPDSLRHLRPESLPLGRLGPAPGGIPTFEVLSAMAEGSSDVGIQ